MTTTSSHSEPSGAVTGRSRSIVQEVGSSSARKGSVPTSNSTVSSSHPLSMSAYLRSKRLAMATTDQRARAKKPTNNSTKMATSHHGVTSVIASTIASAVSPNNTNIVVIRRRAATAHERLRSQRA